VALGALAEQQKTAEAVATLDHSDIRGSEPQGHDSALIVSAHEKGA